MITKTNRFIVIAIIFIMLFSVAAQAEVALPKIFGDRMVFQRKMRVRVAACLSLSRI